MPNQRDPAETRKDAERLADIFTILQRTFVIRLSRELQRGKISFPQYLLLSFLTQQKQLSMTQIAERMGHTTAAATGLVDRLEKLTFVKRKTATEDRRKTFVNATAAGAALVAKVREDMVGTLTEIMSHLPVEDQRAWVRVYETIIAVTKNP